ncbi:uncharacterized protein MELLADRAFT_110741 [Melampsora larici-populina 98AG31]|uniref:Uncharacterized protein n=1 Tax=Melampsora larici-populina (strain 98AG31 / pathotype 3-4-7) TaxID=747676 RepID=F4S0T2_MELLP|nr:uncharacterized protein MELLADRAFT_110741 [Melampsora larici-populina 98AG31]EGG01751.1 hypothetical protein MELLADRAFT_110741 [Melampsora larici-populina 98AG31]
MSASSRKAKDAHRVVCRCKARECYRGQYIDAYGQPQNGVEVLPSTRDAHALADRRKQALGANSAPASSPSARQEDADDLVAPFERLNLPNNHLREQPSATDAPELLTRLARASQGSSRSASSTTERMASANLTPKDIEEVDAHQNNTTGSMIPPYDCAMVYTLSP